MTAEDTNGLGSDNSVSRLVGPESEYVRRDPRTRRIVVYIYNHNGAASLKDLASKGRWTLAETDSFLRALERDNLVQLVGEQHDRIAFLTLRGVRLARGDL